MRTRRPTAERVTHTARQQNRRGVTLVLFAILLLALLGFLGLVIDTGLLLAAHRQTHNAADAAVLAAATAKFRGRTDSEALADANSLLATNSPESQNLELNDPDGNGLNTLNIPPRNGPYAGNAQYLEAIVTTPVQTLFMHLLGGASNRQVQARAVAGFESLSRGEGAIVLDPNARPGLSVQGNNAKLMVNGSIVVNSTAEGWDQYGVWVDTAMDQSYAVQTQPVPAIEARYLQVVGGVDNLAAIQYYEDPTGPFPLFARAEIAPDPLQKLPTPTVENGVVNVLLGAPSISSNGANGLVSPNAIDATTGVVTLNPGIYDSISIQGGTVVFQPGIYVLAGGNVTTLKISGTTTTVTGTGVMFYNTGHNYKPSDGTPDRNDGENAPPASDNPKLGGLTINAKTVDLEGLKDPASPFDGVLFYQRRKNSSSADIQGNAGEDFSMNGVIYAKWANFKLAGQGKYNATFVVGSMAISGLATVTLQGSGKNFGAANQVFLVE